MNDSIGVYTKLRDPALSLEKKLSIAENAWSDEKCFIPNKRQVLLDWVCQKLVDLVVYRKDKRTSDCSHTYAVTEDLWKYLKNILQSLSKPVEREKRVHVPLTLMPQLLQVLSKTFLDHCSSKQSRLTEEHESIMLLVIHCGQIVLSHSDLKTSILAKFENYVTFMSSVLSAFVAFMNESSINHKICKEIFYLLEISLNLYICLQRKQNNHRKLFERTCEYLIGPLLHVRYLLKNIGQYQIDLCEITEDKISAVVCLLHQIMSDALFRREHLSDYSSALRALKDEHKQDDTKEPQSKKPCLGNYTKLLFNTLKNQLKCSKDVKLVKTIESGEYVYSDHHALLDSLPRLYTEFLKSRRRNQYPPSSLEFEFFTEICILLGINDDLTECADHLPKVLPHVYCLLDSLLTFDVYQVGEDNANDGCQLKWLLNFAKHLLAIPTSLDVYHCLEVLLNLNHSIIEPHLSTVFQYMFWSNEAVMEADISFGDSFFSSVVKTYVKLRQFDKLISQMLESLKVTKNMKSKWKGFPDVMKDELIKASQSLPYGLSTSLWKIFNTEILQICLPALQATSENTKQILSKHENKRSQTQLIYSLERVAGLFSLFLLNTTLGGVTEQHKVDATNKTLSSLYYESVVDVLGPLWTVLSKISDNKLHNSICISILVLFHALQEMKVFLRNLGCISEDLNAYWKKYICVYLHQNMKTANEGNERLRYLLGLLCIQRVRIKLLQDSAAHHEPEVQQLIDYVFNLTDTISFSTPSHSWNKQVWSINKNNFSLAYWYSLCDQATLLLTVCSDKQRQQFTQFLIKTMIKTNMDPASNLKPNSDNVLTIQSLSKTLLHSAGFHQVPSMQTSLVSCIWQHIGDILSLCDLKTQPQKRLADIITAIGALDAVNDGNRNIDNGVILDREDSDNDSASSSEEEEDVDEVDQKSIENGVNALIPLGEAFDKALEELNEPLKKIFLQNHLKDAEGVENITKCLSILALLPLDWLTDVNHLSCILGLMTCNVLLHSNLQQGASKEYLHVLFLDHQLLYILMNGSISRKRFLIQHVINLDSFLNWMLSFLKSCQIEPEDFSNKQNLSINLFCTLVKYSLKIAIPTTSVYGCINMLTDSLEGLTKELQHASYSSIVKVVNANKPLLRIFGGVLTVLEKVIACKTSRLNEVRMAAKLTANMTPSLLNLLGIITSNSHKKNSTKKKSSSSDTHLVDALLPCLPVLIDCYTAVIHVYCISQTSRKLSQTKEECQLWQWQPVLPFILAFAVNSLGIPQEDNANQVHKNTACTKSCLHFLDVVCLSLETLEFDHLPKDFHCSLLATLLSFLNHLEATRGHSIVELREKALTVVLSLMLGSASETLVVLLNGISNELTSESLKPSLTPRLSTCIHVWSMILSGRFIKLKKKELCPVLPQVLVGLQSILQISTNTDLSVLTLEVMTKILSLGMSFIQPHHCTMAFHGSLLMPLNDNHEKFPQLFQAQYSLLSSILYHQSDAVYNSVHVFVTCVKNMLLGLGVHCDNRSTQVQEDISKSDRRNLENDQLVCAHKMARLYQEIASHKATFSKYAPYMIADYIQQIQQVSLQSQVKQALVPGIYCLLDTCGEHEMALLHAVLDKGSRELFNSLNDDYNKFHKFKGKV